MNNLLGRLSLLSIAMLFILIAGCSDDKQDQITPKSLPEKAMILFDIENSTWTTNDEVKITLFIKKQSTIDWSESTVLDSTFYIFTKDVPSVISIRKAVLLNDPSTETLLACLSAHSDKLRVGSSSCQSWEGHGLTTHLSIRTDWTH